MGLPLQDRAYDGQSNTLVRLTEDGLVFYAPPTVSSPALLPQRPLQEGEQYRFHFDMTKCIGCRSCEIACNEQNGNPADIQWRRTGELEGGAYPDTQRHYLSMGCNHCLDAECLKGCPVDAYKKDPVTGIVMHSTDACIGCQYCVWNCPYSVPQFNPERGVVGKCDMCQGRLEEGQEPACVNACPEAAIEIEIVNMLAWREDYSAAESPGMPAAIHTISTTRITLPETDGVVLERVDGGQIQPEHAHLSLVFMTTLMQAVAGALWVMLLTHTYSALRMGVLFTMTVVALTISTMHLGRPAYAWRALKMWRRSWLSREVLLFTLFFMALAAATAATVATQFPQFLQAAHIALRISPLAVTATIAIAAVLGVLGTLASSAIYLVPARPSWNMRHTPVDFLLAGALLGPLLTSAMGVPSAAPIAVAAALWLANQAVRLRRLKSGGLFESRASYSLMMSRALFAQTVGSFVLVALCVAAAYAGYAAVALIFGAVGVLLARYLFFVSVVPLSMGLTFVRSRHA